MNIKKLVHFLKNQKIILYVNIILIFFMLGIVFSPFIRYANKNLFVSADSKNPLEGSADIQGALVLQNALRRIYKEVNPSVVRIETEQYIKNSPHLQDPFFRFFFGERSNPFGFNQPKRNAPQKKKQGLGSGFIIKSDGYIVTNNHVIAPNGQKVDKINIRLVNGNVYEAKVVGSDKVSDLALLKIEAKDLKESHIGNSDEIEVGDISIAIGNPFGLSATFTMGVISSKEQKIRTEDGLFRIQTDAAINPGNSGGPLLNLKGEVIGINQMIYTNRGTGGSLGIGFAIPINYAMSILNKLKEGKEIKYGYIGVSIKEVSILSDQEKKELQIKNKKGLFVSEVKLGSPSWKAGLRPYDFIIKIDSKPATKFSDLKSKVIQKGPGKKILITVIRDKKERNFSVKIGTAPESN